LVERQHRRPLNSRSLYSAALSEVLLSVLLLSVVLSDVDGLSLEEADAVGAPPPPPELFCTDTEVPPLPAWTV
jgi:hypothetical protein